MSGEEGAGSDGEKQEEEEKKENVDRVARGRVAKLEEQEEEQERRITWVELEGGEERHARTSCGHGYHRNCLDAWLAKYGDKDFPTCPLLLHRDVK
jgi:hypothetical protein